MDGTMLKLMRSLLLLTFCSVVALAVLAVAQSQDFLSGRELGLAMLGLSVAIGVSGVAIIRKSKRDSLVPPAQTPNSVDAATRKRRLFGIWLANATIAALALLLIIGLLQGGPWLPRVVGAAVNLAFIAVLVRLVAGLRKSVR